MNGETAERLRRRIEDGLRATGELRRMMLDEERRAARPQLRLIQGGAR